MIECRWLPLDAVLAFHDQALADYGGLDGIRDLGALEGGLERPKTLAAYGDPEPDLADLAAMHLVGIAKAHAFADGNKRTAWASAYAFLYLNGFDLNFDDVDAVQTTLRAAKGTIEHAELALWYQDRMKPV